MFNLILHYVIYGLFEAHLFFGYWFLRITFLDYLSEYVILKMAKKAKVNLVLAYKRKGKDVNQNDVFNLEDSDDKTPTFYIYDRCFFAMATVYPSLGAAEAFIVSQTCVKL